MKINNNSKYMLYIILFIIFILIRINYVLLSGEIEELSFRGLAISKCFYPFETLKEAILNTNFLPFYYLVTGILRNEIVIKIFNAFLALGNIYILILIGKKLLNEKLGYFLGFLLALNHFYLYYTNLIAPYVLIFLIQTLTINALIDYFKKPTRKTFKNLNIFNCALILVDSFGFLYVISELAIIYLLSKKKKNHSFYFSRLLNFSFIPFLLVLPILFVQYIVSTKILITNTQGGIGLNFSSLYLTFSEYFSPYLSFLAPENQAKSTLGLVYSFFMNPDLGNINSLKILITLFYSSILPLIIMISMSIRAILKNETLKYIFYISAINFGLILALMLFEKIETTPINLSVFFITILILMGYGILSLKDVFIKTIIICCLIGIQFVNPDVNSFDITIKKNYAMLNPIEIFLDENSINKEDLVIMPYNGRFGEIYFKKQINVLDYDDEYLKISKKKGLLRNLSNKNSKRITRKNIHLMLQDYLFEAKTNAYLTSYFVEKIFKDKKPPRKIVLIVDKLNSKPISNNSILKCASNVNYKTNLRKIDFRYFNLNQSDSDILFDALKSKTLYNFANILSTDFGLTSIVEYKKLENEYYKVPPSKNIYKAMASYNSDYAFLIFE